MGSASLDLLTATAGDLQKELSSGNLTSAQLVNACLDQIEKHDGYLHGVIAKAPRGSITQQAQTLDDERAAGKLRGRLHGIPILLKDNIATHPKLQMDTTAGSFAFVGSRSKQNATIVDSLLQAGALVIGKANLSELSYWKGSKLACGWSAVGGQGQSPYVRGGFKSDDTFAGHSNIGGSSSGSAIGVAAGYAPISIGTETEGSLILPGNRAALYTIKPTISIVPQNGIIPVTSLFDSAGPMTKSVKDLANLMDVIVDPARTRVPTKGYISAASKEWTGLRIGTLDPEIWNFDTEYRKPELAADMQMNDETLSAYKQLRDLADSFHDNVSLIAETEFDLEGKNCVKTLCAFTFKRDLEAYLADIEDSKVRSLEDLIRFNKDNAEIELPPENPNQSVLEDAASINLTAQRYHEILEHVRLIGRKHGIDETFSKYDINVLIGPAESHMTQFAAATGYPIATLPLGYLNFNGRPHGLAAIALAHQEALLIQLQSAWEVTFPKRKPPPL